jgi:VWFA-related protein
MIRRATAYAFQADDQERMVRTLAALKVICNELSPLRGRKSLLWITGGLSAPGESREVQDAIDRLNDSNVAVYTVYARGVVMDSQINAENDSKDMAGPMREAREEVRDDVLAVMAYSTGGVFYRNNNRLDDAINQAFDDRSLVYVLQYYPQHGDWHGNMHKLEVKTTRPGVRLRYRATYRAAQPAIPSAHDQKQMLAAITSSPLDYAGIRFSVEVKPGKDADPILSSTCP